MSSDNDGLQINKKIKIVHILNRLDGEREIKSIESLSKLKNYGIDYIQLLTPLYEGEEWKTPSVSGLPNGKGHYGNYLNFKKAINDEFSKELDALIICECDCVLNIPHENFINEMQKTLDFCQKYDIYQFSWGGNKCNLGIEQGYVAKTDPEYPNYCIVNKIILAHFTILTKSSRQFYLDKIHNTGWDTPDIWLNVMIYDTFSERKQATVFNKLAYQAGGLSSLDNIIKNEEVKFLDKLENFNITCNKDENKTYISYKYNIEVNVLLYDWNPINNNINLIYQTTTIFNNNRFWYATAINLNELTGLKVEIKYNNRIIKEEYFNFQEQQIIESKIEEKSKYKKIVLISSYCDTEEKINILKTNIDTIKNLGLDVMLNSPISLPLDLINKCDYFFLTKDNPVLEWPQKAVYSWRRIIVKDKEVQLNVTLQDYGWANIYQIKKLSEFALTFDYDYFYHIIYDLIIDDVVVDGFKSERKCSFYHFHEHNVSLHLMSFDREHLNKFLSELTLQNYLDIGGIAEQWLDRLLTLNRFDYQIENSFVDDKILFHRYVNLFNNSKIDELCFFITKHDADLSNIQLFFYNIIDNINIKINNINYIISNGDFIDLGFNKENIIETIIEYNDISQNITDDIKNIIHNTISSI